MSTIANEQHASDILRLRNLIDGIVGLLTGDCPPKAVHAAREVALQARGVAAVMVDALDRNEATGGLR